MKAIKTFFAFFFICLTLSAFAQQKTVNKQDYTDKMKIDDYLKTVMHQHEIPGLALAVIKDGKILYESYNGIASIEQDYPVDENSIFRIYSATKLISSVAIFQLIEQGKLSLEDEISKFIDGLPKIWQKVRVENLLTHSSGLPDIIYQDGSLEDKELMEVLFKEEMEFETGNHFKYNQTNYWLLSQIIEKIEGSTFDEFVMSNQFSKDNKNVFFNSNSLKEIPNRICKYNYNPEEHAYEKTTYDDGVRAHSGNGLNITLKEFIAWNARLDQNKLLKEETKEKMWTEFNFSNGQDHFLYGWGLYPRANSTSIGFTGGQVAAFRKFTKNDLTIIYLSNGFKNISMHNYVVDHVAGLVDKSLADKSKIAEEGILTNFINKKYSIGERIFYAAKANNPEFNLEGLINGIGYLHLGNNDIKEAIQLFELNAKEYPKSSNVFDSLAEGYANNKQFELAIKNYKKSLELDPGNENAKMMIEQIQDEMED